MEPEKKQKDKKVLTLFILMTVSVLLAITSAISELVVRVGIQIVLLLLDYVLIKNVIDSYYGDDTE